MTTDNTPIVNVTPDDSHDLKTTIIMVLAGVGIYTVGKTVGRLREEIRQAKMHREM